MDMNALKNLESWYAAQCDGDWEHQFGIKIETVDNPGWVATIELSDTTLSEKAFPEVVEHYDHETEWLRCWREGSQFKIACGPSRLSDGLRVFLAWAGLI